MQASSGILTIPSTAAPFTVSVNTLSFQPDVVIFHTTNALPAQLNANAVFSVIGFGAGDGTNQFACGVASEDNVSTSDTTRFVFNNICISAQDPNGGSFFFAAELQSLNADGFTLNVTVNNGVEHLVGWTALEGVDVAIIQDELVDDAATYTNTSLGFQPTALIMASAFTGSPNSPQNAAHFSFGYTDGTNQWFNAFVDENNDSPSISMNEMGSDAILKMIDSGASGYFIECDLEEFLSNGFTLNVTEKVGFTNNREFGIIALGGVPALVGQGAIPTTIGTTFHDTDFDVEWSLLSGTRGTVA
jgi:hypothetical protein